MWGREEDDSEPVALFWCLISPPRLVELILLDDVVVELGLSWELVLRRLLGVDSCSAEGESARRIVVSDTVGFAVLTWESGFAASVDCESSSGLLCARTDFWLGVSTDSRMLLRHASMKSRSEWGRIR